MAIVLGTGPALAGSYVQAVVLEPGWNAVYLEVRPDPEDLDTALAGVPVASVWAWNPKASTVDFIQDPDEGLLTTDGWQGYFPRPRPEAFLTNLFILQANRAYLIKLDGDQPVTWRVSGKPELRTRTWVTDSYNLTGFAVDESNPPTFGAYFGGIAAHEGQPIYQLGSDGAWSLVEQPYSTSIVAGRAYWVFCHGASTYQGPLEVEVAIGDSLEYSASISEQGLTLRNKTDFSADISLRLLAGSQSVPLVYRLEDEQTGQISWPELPSQLSLPAVPGQQLLLTLGVQRARLADHRAEQVLEISNGLGSRRLVEVGVETVQVLGAKAGRSGKVVSTPYAGLWVGYASINAVSEAQTGGTTPVTTGDGKTFPIRLILHVDAGGQVRLLKEVIQMWQHGTMAPDPENPDYLTVDTPGRYVLVTDDDLIPGFEGVALRDGIPVGLRVSTVAYDFPTGVNEVDMTGSLDPSGYLLVNLVLESQHPTNPFKHKYHPDHDNLDAQFLSFEPEAFEINRRIELFFSPEAPEGTTTPPDWGDSQLGGTYSERLTGLHRNPIYVSGSFRLKRISGVSVLNS